MPINRIAVLCLGLAGFWATATPAAPILVDYDMIIPFTTEDFETTPAGGITDPGSFDGFDFSATDPFIADFDTLCRSEGQCLSAEDLLASGRRTLLNFEPGTKSLGLLLSFVNADQYPTIEIRVEGRNSTSVFSGFTTSDLSTKLAFQDVQGLNRVTFQITSDIDGPNGPFRTNFAFDDIVTSKRPVTPIPAPVGIVLLGGALGALGALQRVARGSETSGI